MKKVGIIVAIEINAIFKLYPECKEIEANKGYKVFYAKKENVEIYILRSGMGEVRAASGVQCLISKYNVEMIINFGVVGGLTSEMKKQKICVVERVVHYKYDCSEFLDLAIGQVDGYDSIYLDTDKNLLNKACELLDLKKVICASGDKFIGTETEKKYLNDTFKGDICDMESAGIVLTCHMNDVPCLLLKAVSDGLSDGANSFFEELETASFECLKVADKVIDNIK